jgi:uncharacterized RDD family membrane protein YckC
MNSSEQQLDNAYDVVTPENIAFAYKVAGPFRRLGAYLIDVGIRVVVIGGFTMLAGLVIGMAGISVAMPVLQGVVLLIVFVAEWFYGGLFETYWNGQTPGKRMTGLRVVTTSGQPINGWQAVMRNLLRYVDLFPLLSIEVLGIPAPVYVIPTALAGIAAMAISPRFQRIGDLVCDTMVVIEDRQWLMGVTRLDDPRAVQLAAYLPMKFQVSRSLAKAISAYVERRRYFSIPRRREIARHLGEPLLEKFGLPVDTSHDLLLCALYYRTFIADRQDDDEHAAAIALSMQPAYAVPGYAATGHAAPGYAAPGYYPPHGAPAYGQPQYSAPYGPQYGVPFPGPPPSGAAPYNPSVGGYPVGQAPAGAPDGITFVGPEQPATNSAAPKQG